MTTPKSLLRALRDLSIALAGLILAVATRAGGWAAIVTWGIWGAWFASGVVAWQLSHRYLPSHPLRAVIALEWKVRLLYASSSVLPFAGMFITLGFLSAKFSEASEKYWFGAASGFILAGLSAALISPGKDKDWIADHIEAVFQKEYEQKFFQVDISGRPIAGSMTGGAIWHPHGMEGEAIYEEDYDDSGVRVEGWDFSNRRSRARTLEHGLKNPNSV
ncbi:hypothetical protein [Streptomyces hesseae]|uniref:Uncharacterized protein n=1 Tax=Streptomyces hesseae TaxID=3075519 RepID=A0ABU2SLV2_9ACTN|nr:hypothetical protein [Streptomyces sp. DSM 40473]MDT0449961.1 hypothetical protein [Streptomyces sp. DSM 40473]